MLCSPKSLILFLIFALIHEISACSQNFECPTGPGCVKSEYGEEGALCGTTEYRCYADLFCDQTDRVCRKYNEEGGKCGGGRNRCVAGTFCYRDVCRIARPAQGSICASNGDCFWPDIYESGAPQLVCRYDQLFTELTEQYAATHLRSCQTALAGHFGENCEKDSDCGADLQCKFGVCLAKTVTNKCSPKYFNCDTGVDCCSGECIETSERRPPGGGEGDILKYCA